MRHLLSPERLVPAARFALVTAALALLSGNARAELLFGVTDPAFGALSLVSFDSATPSTLTTVAPITGLVAGHTLRGIDFRPSDGQLYALSNAGTGTAAQLYTVNLTTGALTTIGAGLTLTGNTSARISLDFNPVVDALRVITGSTQNFRVNPNTGALIAQDTNISPNAIYAGIAYTNNFVGATSTTLYAYDFSNDTIGTIGSIGGTPSSPNGGVYTTVGGSGFVAFAANLGFDISGATGAAYISMDDNDSPNDNTEFFTVNLTTGAMSLVGNFPVPLLDISVRPVAVSATAPEPGTFALLALSGLPLAGAVLRRRRAS